MVEAFGARAWILVSTRGVSDGEYRVVQLLLGGRDVDDQDPWAGQEFPLYRGGVIGAIVQNPYPQIVNDVDWTSDPFFHDTLDGYGSLLAIPLLGESLPTTWVLLLKRAPARFRTAEVEQAVLRSAIIGSLLESKALAADLARAHRRIDADARQVGELQRALLPQPLPQIPGLEIAASCQPCGRAGGDLYDFFPLDEVDSGGKPRRWCVFVGDASGHGLAAAVVMTMVQSILHAHPPEISSPADLLAHANRHLCREQIGGFVTAFLGVYEPSTRRLTYACAGHPPPLVKTSADGAVSRLDEVASCPLGVEVRESWAEATVHIRPNDTVLLYTDGITEARDWGNEMFSESRLALAFANCRDTPADLVERLERLVSAHRQGRPPMDDHTLVTMAGL
jgi:sigma-B regulation protein RsbU (phosphoserine phosphatase)